MGQRLEQDPFRTEKTPENSLYRSGTRGKNCGGKGEWGQECFYYLQADSDTTRTNKETTGGGYN